MKNSLILIVLLIIAASMFFNSMLIQCENSETFVFLLRVYSCF